jgi:LysR family glycine cleavage system transcriptional activator
MSGRYLNIARAAQELGVSSGAVSQQIHSLEKWMGCRLFRRGNRGLTFTPAGETFHEAVSEALGTIRKATKTVSRPEVRQAFIISVTASFAMKFLLPHLSEFRDKWPNIDISVSTVELINEFQPADGDVGIRYGITAQQGVWSREIIRDDLILVASPNLIASAGNKMLLEDIPDYPLLMDRHPKVIDEYPSWEEYFLSQGLLDPHALKIREFSQHWMVIEAAINGEGTALVKKSLAQEDVKSGRLVRLAAKEMKLKSGYFLVTLPENSNDPIIRSFHHWLQKVAKI